MTITTTKPLYLGDSHLIPTIEVERVKLDAHGYDARGEYFGVGPKLYRCDWAATEHLNGGKYHVRADSASDARKQAAQHLRRKLATLGMVG